METLHLSKSLCHQPSYVFFDFCVFADFMIENWFQFFPLSLRPSFSASNAPFQSGHSGEAIACWSILSSLESMCFAISCGNNSAACIAERGVI